MEPGRTSTRADAVAGTSGLPFAGLEPALILDAVERLGLEPDGGLLALNSYENRVYRVGVRDAPARVLKFYRPGRWSDRAIAEEHAFTAELEAAEVPVVAPERFDGVTLHRHRGFRYAVFPLRGGHGPELNAREDRVRLGRLVGRLHAVGARGRFVHRPEVSVQRLGEDARDFVLGCGQLPGDMVEPYAAISAQLVSAAAAAFEAVAPQRLRLHGDLHGGNLLCREELLWLVDLDDCASGPAVQDLWMFVDGEGAERDAQLDALLEGYETFRDFDRAELALVEPLRALRMLHFVAWLAQRWADPAFPRAFPWFAERRHWEEHVLVLKEQLAQVQHD